MKSRYSPWTTLATALCLVSLGGMGCGSGHGSGPTATIAVLRGDRAAMANPVGADGLTPVGAGFAVTVEYFPDHVDKNAVSSVKTNNQSRLTIDLGNNEYFCFAPNQCSTVVGIYNSPTMFEANYSTGSFYGNDGSPAMKQKASLAAKALGVDAVILVGTDADVCTAQ